MPRLSARIDAKPCFRMIQCSGGSGSCWPAVLHCTSLEHAIACAVWPHNHAQLSTPSATPRHTVPTLSQAQSRPLSTYHTPTHTCTCARTQTRYRGDRYAALLGSARCVCVCACVRRYVGLVGTKGEKRCGIELDTPDVRSSPPLPSLLLSSPPESEFGRCSGVVRLVFVTGLSLHAQFLGQNG